VGALDAKREHREPPKLQEPESQAGQIVDLMAALNESVQQARASRGEDADVHELPKKKTAKKQPAKKTTTQKTTKAAAKKTSGRRPRSA
jgi:DNA end-binding protein Ku